MSYHTQNRKLLPRRTFNVSFLPPSFKSSKRNSARLLRDQGWHGWQNLVVAESEAALLASQAVGRLLLLLPLLLPHILAHGDVDKLISDIILLMSASGGRGDGGLILVTGEVEAGVADAVGSKLVIDIFKIVAIVMIVVDGGGGGSSSIVGVALVVVGGGVASIAGLVVPCGLIPIGLGLVEKLVGDWKLGVESLLVSFKLSVRCQPLITAPCHR